MLSSMKQAFRPKKESTTTAGAQNPAPLADGATRLEGDWPEANTAPTTTHTNHTLSQTGAPTTTTHTMTGAPTTTHTNHSTTISGNKAAGAVDGHGNAGTITPEAFSGAPWDHHHEKTLEALTHAKEAHIKAVQAHQELQAATQAKHDADIAERNRLELERETEAHRAGHNDLDARTREWEDAKTAVATHRKNHDHHSRLAEEAEAAALAKEEQARRLAPLHEEHERGLRPLQSEATAAQRARAEAEERRAVLVRELEALDASLGGHRDRHTTAMRKLEEHQRLGGDHKTRALAAAEEARALRAKANESRAAFEPHAAKLKDAHGVLATRESAYNKARQHADAVRERLPALQTQAQEAARRAQTSEREARAHATAFEKLKREAEAEDAQKTALWTQAQQAGHLTSEGASKKELHNLADRFHTVLKNPIDTGTLEGSGMASGIPQSKVTGEGRVAEGLAGGKMGSAATGRTGPAMTDDTVSSTGPAASHMGASGSSPARTTTATHEPGMIRKATSVTTPAHTAAPLREE